jgi:16S rRNA (uracil1498-N3)-methyltransferase
MRITRFYCPEKLALGARVPLPKDAAHHAIRVLRLAVDAPLTLFNGDGHEYAGRILRIEKQDAVVQIESATAVSRESPLAVTLVQGISAGDRMDYTLQKAVELGVSAIQPIAAERSVVKLAGERAEKRLAHWQGVVIAACEQCGRNVVPVVRPVSRLPEWLAQGSGGALRILLSPEATHGLAQLDPATRALTLAVGPEGGFSDNEHTLLGQAGFVGVKLGPRILRTETAAVAALSALQSLHGDF